MTTPIPPATQQKLATDFPKGTRHKAKIDIALPLIGSRLGRVAVIATLREKFPEASEKEIEKVVDWCIARNPPASTLGHTPTRRPRQPPRTAGPIRTPLEMADWWLSEIRLEPEDMRAVSPVGIPSEPREYLPLALGSLYREGDHLNVVCKYFMDGPKTKPVGAGKTLKRDDWLEYLKLNDIPQCDGGAWIRLNPCNPAGTGKDGAMTDADVSRFAYTLIESDTLPLPIQLAFFSRWRLPIAAVVLSGGASAHAWVSIDAPDGEKFRATVGHLFGLLRPFGIDQANSNPSRLCRLPGATRKIGAVDTGEQRLLWLNPNVAPLTDETLQRFEESLAFPYPEEKPMKRIAQRAIERYDWMVNNKGKLGVPTGIPLFDKITGGLKNGWTYVVGGPTGGGKSTLALHMAASALNAGVGVLLFSLEMDQDEIFDLLASNYATVDRNCFNNGEFTAADMQRLTANIGTLSNLPLWIDDSALTSAEQIKARVFQLKADNKIGLVIVDYAQFVNPTQFRDNREQQVAAISYTLRATAREAKLPMIVVSQLNDEGKIRESRVLAFNANVVMRTEVQEDRFIVHVEKGRGIPLGRYELVFDRTYARLKPTHPIRDADIPTGVRQPYTE